MAFGHALFLTSGQVTSVAAFEDVLVWEVSASDDPFPELRARQFVDGDESTTPYVALYCFEAVLTLSVDCT
jgi:hypothetical protein